MTSRLHHRSRWAHVNSPDGLIRRKAREDATRVAQAVAAAFVVNDCERLTPLRAICARHSPEGSLVM